MTSRILAILSHINMMNCDANGQCLQHIDNEQLYFIPFHSTSLGFFICSQFTYAIVVWNTLFTNQTKALMNYEQNYTTIAVIVIIMLIKSCNINIIIINNTIKTLLSPSYKTNGKQTMYKARYITYINNFI